MNEIEKSKTTNIVYRKKSLLKILKFKNKIKRQKKNEDKHKKSRQQGQRLQIRTNETKKY